VDGVDRAGQRVVVLREVVSDEDLVQVDVGVDERGQQKVAAAVERIEAFRKVTDRLDALAFDADID
jgi:hypothetical protein